jgi:hypothetical protein
MEDQDPIPAIVGQAVLLKAKVKHEKMMAGLPMTYPFDGEKSVENQVAG